MTERYEIELAVHRETDAAWLVESTDSGPDEPVWLPKSQAEQGERTGKQGTLTTYQFDAAIWWLKQEGFI